MTKNQIIFSALVATSLYAVPVFAADATNTTGVSNDTTVKTTQDSGLTIGDKAHIKGDVYTGSNTSDTSVSTDTRVDNTAAASDRTTNTRTGVGSDTRIMTSDSGTEHRDSGKGHKYGHDKH